MKFVQLTEQEYHEYAKQHTYANFLNSIYSGRKFAHAGWLVQYVGLQDADGVQAATLLVSTPLRKYRYYYAPRGFLLDFRNKAILTMFTNELTAYIRKQNGLYLKIDPYVPYQEHDVDGNIVEGGFCNQDIFENLTQCGFQHQGFYVGYDENVQCRWMSLLHLNGRQEDDIMAAMSPSRRRNLKAALRHAIHVRKLDIDELQIVQNMVNASGERQGFASLSLDYYREEYEIFQEHACAYYAYLDGDEHQNGIMKEKASKEKLMKETQENLKSNPSSKKMLNRLANTEKELKSIHCDLQEIKELIEKYGKEIPLSAAFFLKYGPEILYLAGGSSEELMHFKGSYAIQWHMITMALREGYSIYNFYGISGYFQPHQEGYGVFDFKRGFHADVVELLGDFILPIQPSAYKHYIRMRKLKQTLKRS